MCCGGGAHERANHLVADDRAVRAHRLSQTIGPYLHIGLTWLNTDSLATPDASGERVVIEGRVIDGDGNPVNDAVIEIWQANSHGRYRHPDDTRDLPLDPGFSGFGRVMTGGAGEFRFTTVKPGSIPAAGGRLQAPHLNVTIFMRGLLKHLCTRLYFGGEPINREDVVLSLVPVERRDTLIAKPVRGHPGRYAWDVVLQGEAETVFFDY
jgi:protocatechuate 3,4-dioxygenase alpha subunit